MFESIISERVIKKYFPKASQIQYNNVYIGGAKEVNSLAIDLRNRIISLGIAATVSRFFLCRELKIAVVQYADRLIVVGDFDHLTLGELKRLFDL